MKFLTLSKINKSNLEKLESYKIHKDFFDSLSLLLSLNDKGVYVDNKRVKNSPYVKIYIVNSHVLELLPYMSSEEKEPLKKQEYFEGYDSEFKGYTSSQMKFFYKNYEYFLNRFDKSTILNAIIHLAKKL